MVSMQQVEEAALEGNQALDALLLPLDTALSDWPAVQLNEDSSYYLKMGQAVVVPKAPTEGWVRLYEGADRFIGVGVVQDDGRIAPKRLLVGK
jgi:tRNA pseudouridine55 synthase